MTPRRSPRTSPALNRAAPPASPARTTSPRLFSPSSAKKTSVVESYDAFATQARKSCADSADPCANLAEVVVIACEEAVKRRVPAPRVLALDWLPRCVAMLEEEQGEEGDEGDQKPRFSARGARKALRKRCLRTPIVQPGSEKKEPVSADATRRFLRDTELQILMRLAIASLGKKQDEISRKEIGAIRSLLEAASFSLQAPHIECEPARRERSQESAHYKVGYSSLEDFFDSALRPPLAEIAPKTLLALQEAFEFASPDNDEEPKKSAPPKKAESLLPKEKPKKEATSTEVLARATRERQLVVEKGRNVRRTASTLKMAAHIAETRASAVEEPPKPPMMPTSFTASSPCRKAKPKESMSTLASPSPPRERGGARATKQAKRPNAAERRAKSKQQKTSPEAGPPTPPAEETCIEETPPSKGAAPVTGGLTRSQSIPGRKLF